MDGWSTRQGGVRDTVSSRGAPQRASSASSSPRPVTRVVHHGGIGVPTLRLATEQSLSETGIALLLQMLLGLHSRLQDTRVRKIY